MPFDLNRLKTLLTKYEHSIDWLYLDSVGLVTVGIGFMLPSAHDAASHVDWFVSYKIDEKGQPVGAGKPATQKEVLAAYEAVAKDAAAQRKRPNKDKHTAKFYRTFSGLRMPRARQETELEERIAKHTKELRGVFPDFDRYPADAQIALLDMHFNLGHPKFLHYQNLIRAVQSEDWRTVADQSHRGGIGHERNDEIEELFLDAAEAAESRRRLMDIRRSVPGMRAMLA